MLHNFKHQLKPCPFCNEVDRIEIDFYNEICSLDTEGNLRYEYTYNVVCCNCRMRGPVAKTEHSAVELYNNRA